jgi:rfaE bifunctional protein kinase chain/domain
MNALRSSSRDRLMEAIDRFDGTRVLAVADLVLDVFEYGAIDRISREAPVLILNHVRTDHLPGGGANAIRNLRSLDAQPIVVGRVGEDREGEILVDLLQRSGVDTGGIWRDADYRTPVKRRILGGSAQSVKQQLVRIDAGGGPPVDGARAPILESIRRLLEGADGVLVSDYSLGLLNSSTIGPLLRAINGRSLRLFVDSRSQIAAFSGMTAATPNLPEAEAAVGGHIDDNAAALSRAGHSLRVSLRAEAILLTRGSQGMSLFCADGSAAHLPVYGTDEVADVTGAGDTVISVFSLAVLSGASFLDAALLSNYAGGIVVMKRGTACLNRDELREAVRTDPDLERRVSIQ